MAQSQSDKLLQCVQETKLRRAAIRQHRRSQETHLIYSKTKKSVFLYVNIYLANRVHSIQLFSHGSVLHAANVLLREFSENFSINCQQAEGLADADFSGTSNSTQFVLNCTTTMVQAAIAVFANKQ